MKKYIYSLLLLLFGVGVYSCSDSDNPIDPNSSEPVVQFAFEELTADLNKVDNLPVVAVIKSEVGLKYIKMEIQLTDETLLPYKEVSEFFNNKSYSLSEKLKYANDYKAFIVSGEDQLGRVFEHSLPLNIIDIKKAPIIIFNPAIIVYDERENLPMPNTHFTITCEVPYKSIEMHVVGKDGQTPYGSTIYETGEVDFNFDEAVPYKEGDKGFRVKVVDKYDQTTVQTLPVKYLTALPPILSIEKDTIFADKDEVVSIPLSIESERGLKEVIVYRMDDGQFLEVDTIETPDMPKKYEKDVEVQLTNATTRVKFVAVDQGDKKDEKEIITIVNLMFIDDLQVGSQFSAGGNINYPGIYSLLSLKDLKTYSVDYGLENKQNAANLDIKFHIHGGQAIMRIYSMDGEKNGEHSGKNGSVNDFEVKNKTRFQKLQEGFDFENATAASIERDVISSQIKSAKIDPLKIGDVVAFRTGGSSSLGQGKVGLIKIMNCERAHKIPGNITAQIFTIAIKYAKE